MPYMDHLGKEKMPPGKRDSNCKTHHFWGSMIYVSFQGVQILEHLIKTTQTEQKGMNQRVLNHHFP